MFLVAFEKSVKTHRQSFAISGHHLLGLLVFAADVLDHHAFNVGGDDVDVDGLGLAKTSSGGRPAVLLPGIRRADKDHVRAMLEFMPNPAIRTLDTSTRCVPSRNPIIHCPCPSCRYRQSGRHR